MFSRTFKIALILSLGVHVFWMSLIGLVAPEDGSRNRPYTRVDFLGPILRKSAFDVMLDNNYYTDDGIFSDGFSIVEENYLDINIERGAGEIAVSHTSSDEDNFIDGSIIELIKEPKTLPDIILDAGQGILPRDGRFTRYDQDKSTKRSVIYRPDAPEIEIKDYLGGNGKKDIFISSSVLVSPDGSVKRVGSLTTTGSPEIDMIASKYVKGWIFEPVMGESMSDEWVNVEFVLKSGE